MKILYQWLKSRTIRWGIILNAAAVASNLAGMLPPEYAVPVVAALNAIITIINRIRTTEPLADK